MSRNINNFSFEWEYRNGMTSIKEIQSWLKTILSEEEYDYRTAFWKYSTL